jgi:hypothetical protein
MQETETKTRSVVIQLVWAALLPLAVISVFWICMSLLHHNGTSTYSALPAFALAIAAGAWPVLRLPFRLPYRLLCLLAYVPAAYALLFFYSLLFLGLVLHVGLDHGS